MEETFLALHRVVFGATSSRFPLQYHCVILMTFYLIGLHYPNPSLLQCHDPDHIYLYYTSIGRFSKLTKFSANCHFANDWSCIVEHKLLHPSDSPVKVVLWYSSSLISQSFGVQSPTLVGDFLIF